MNEGEVWLDQIPSEPTLVACVGCGDPLQPLEVMIKWAGGEPLHPLCRQCFDGPPAPDPWSLRCYESDDDH